MRKYPKLIIKNIHSQETERREVRMSRLQKFFVRMLDIPIRTEVSITAEVTVEDLMGVKPSDIFVDIWGTRWYLLKFEGRRVTLKSGSAEQVETLKIGSMLGLYAQAYRESKPSPS